MSIFSFLGKAVKSVGKVALGAAGAVTGIGGLATIFDKKSTNEISPAGVTAGASLNIGASVDTQNAGGVSLLGAFKGVLNSASDFLSGRTHVQADVHTEIGGTRDPYGSTNTGSGLPSWLLPVAIGGGLLMLLMGGKSSGGGRRY